MTPAAQSLGSARAKGAPAPINLPRWRAVLLFGALVMLFVGLGCRSVFSAVDR